MTRHAVVSQDQWTTARRELLRKEKAFTHEREQLARELRELPWVKVTRNYTFDGPSGKESLSDLFAGRGQLIVYHFMLAPGWKEGCKGCSFVSDHIDGAIPHLAARDVTLLAISRAPLAEINAFKKRMGWRFKWVSSNANDFNRDFGVSFSKEDLSRTGTTYNYAPISGAPDELPGASVFIKDEKGDIYHTYSTYARGLENLVGTYSFLDLTPKGRDEDKESPMSWVRHHDRYETAPAAHSCCEEAHA